MRSTTKVLELLNQPLIKALCKFAVLFFFVLCINYPIITSHFFYPEQPTIYFANQEIKTVYDLINIYLHPKWLHAVIPFFRPTGHFLIYQLIVPFIGWHNTQAFLIINLFFLALTGSFIIANYKLLFPRMRAGAYIAFAIYLIHPALTLSRFTALHFEFASTFFLLLGLYFFLRFCKTNRINFTNNKIHHSYQLFFAVLSYILAVTFKETAIILGPILCGYFLLLLMRTHHPLYLFSFLSQKIVLEIFAFLIVTTITLAIYLTLPWPNLTHPLRPLVAINSLGAANELINGFLGTNKVYFSHGFLVAAGLIWRTAVFTPAIFYLVQFFIIITLCCAFILCFNHSAKFIPYKKPFLFVFISFLLSLILPLAWAVGAPWHLNFPILFFAMLAGFSVELFIQLLFKKHCQTHSILFAAFCISLLAISMNKTNLQAFNSKKGLAYSMSLNENAISHPPTLANLNADSLLIVEDSNVHNDYSLGNAAYPFFLFLTENDFPDFNNKQNSYFIKFNLSYSGNLFRLAYLMPQLKEELYPFNVNAMNDVPNEVIYDWLLHYPNIFCVGYDTKANWYDRTQLFKQNLLREKLRRNILVHPYQTLDKLTFRSQPFLKKTLSVPDQKLCQYACDQDKRCTAFTYRDIGFYRRQCEFYHYSAKYQQIPCEFCVSAIKLNA